MHLLNIANLKNQGVGGFMVELTWWMVNVLKAFLFSKNEFYFMTFPMGMWIRYTYQQLQDDVLNLNSKKKMEISTKMRQL